MRGPGSDPAGAALEARVARGVVAATTLIFVAALVVAGRRFETFDDAKYLGIGLNVLAGRGPLTPFGVFFEPHSPLWPLVIALPQRFLGVDAFAWSHVLNVVAAAAALVLVAIVGWPIRPAVGALAAVGFVAFPYVDDLSRRIGLDMPVVALSLLYLVVGRVAVRRGTIGTAVVAGLVFGIAALTKESVLALAPVPFLAGLAAGRRPSAVARSGAIALGVAAVVTSPWLWVFAQQTGRVYRVGTPAWTLVPLAIAVAVAVAAGVAWPRSRSAALGRDRARAIAALLAAGWIAVQVLLYDRAQELRGRGLLDVAQLRYYGATWFEQLSPALALGGVGAAIDAVARLTRRTRPSDAATEAWLALACSVPLVLLVVGVGELPRHYVAQIALLFVVGTSGWLWLTERVLARPSAGTAAAVAIAVGAALAVVAPLARGRPVLLVGAAVVAVGAMAGVAVALARPGPRAALAQWVRRGRLAALVVVAACVAGAGTLGLRLSEAAPSRQLDAARSAAVTTVTAWARETLPRGGTIAFGQTLSQEMAVRVMADFDTVQVRERRDLVLDPSAPLAVSSSREAPADDWIAIALFPGSVTGFVGYRASDLAEDLRDRHVDVWVHVTATDLTEPLVVDRALTADAGFERVGDWTWPTSTGKLEALAFRVDAPRVAFGRTVWISEDALERIVAGLEAQRSGTRQVAANVLARVAVVPESSRADALRVRLRVLAGD